MTKSFSPLTLLASRSILSALTVLNLIFGGLIVVLFIASLLAEEWVMGALGVRPTGNNVMLIQGMRLIMVMGIGSVPLAHVVLTRLRAIVDTVSLGDPFMVVNAERLQTIAWSLLGLELIHLVVGTVAAAVSSEANPLDINWSFSMTGWLAVLLLFVLARVFDHGARMREDLEGTV